MIFAGIDEAGYGPRFGPMVIGRCALRFEVDLPAAASQPISCVALPDLWQVLRAAVCRKANDKRRRLAVDDSKKLFSQSKGIATLERSVLGFAATAAPDVCHRLDGFLAAMDSEAMVCCQQVPWYAGSPDFPWQPLPVSSNAKPTTLACNSLKNAMPKVGLQHVELASHVITEKQLNDRYQRTRSKASVSFTAVADHLLRIWNQRDGHDVVVVVDRQSGRHFYRDPLMQVFTRHRFAVLEESAQSSVYRISQANQPGEMTVAFATRADSLHLPTALASMVSKYLRELLMMRFQKWFQSQLPHVRPTAGYGEDGRRFMQQLTPHLESLGIEPGDLIRCC